MRRVPDTSAVRGLEKRLEGLRDAVVEVETAFWGALPDRRTAEVNPEELVSIATDVYRAVDEMEQWMSQHLPQPIPANSALVAATPGRR